MAQIIRLEPGANVALTAENPDLNELVIGFGWEIRQPSGPQIEVVPSALMCNADNVAVSDESLVFFNQLATTDGAVRYVSGDDAEQIEVTLSLVPTEVEKIIFVAYVNPDSRQPGNFGAVRDAYIRVTDRHDNEIVRFELPQASIDVTAMLFGELYRHRGQWKFRAVGQGYNNGLVGVARDFKVGI